MTTKTQRQTAEVFGLQDGCVAFLSHCGSRGIGHRLASGQFKALEAKFESMGHSRCRGSDKQLVYAPLGTKEADNYSGRHGDGRELCDRQPFVDQRIGVGSFPRSDPGTTGSLVYFISHNIARKEIVDNRETWVHRKGATRAFPAGHHTLKRTPFDDTRGIRSCCRATRKRVRR